ncbi:MAG: cation:proton antiporter [Fibrobacteria bacterium]|nr:cation:proton antiporter [Fibrobacteria bacterium]
MTSDILLQMVIYLAAAVLCVPLAKKFRMGSVLGYLAAGMLIGPFGLGWVGDEGESIKHFAEFGVVVMLFLVGLELEPRRFWAMRGLVLGMGTAQVLATAAVLSGIGIAVGLDWKAAFAASLALAMSSTAMALQSLKEKGLMESVAGRQSFAILLFQDIAVIPILALLPLLAVHSGPTGAHGAGSPLDALPAWLRTIAVLAVIASVLAAGRWAVVPALRLVARTRLRELFIASSLLLVVGVAWLMQMVGLSPALGTFLAGLVLSGSEFRHELESDLEPFKGLLLGLFFIAVGASIDFGLIASMPLRIASWTLGVLLVKGVVLALLAWTAKSAIDQAVILSTGLSQVGEFAFVLVAFITGLGLVDPQLGALLVAVTALSMTISPVLGLLSEVLVLPRLLANPSKPERAPDNIDERNCVIIAGFSHFGSTVGRFLRANGIGITILDDDSAQVEFLRRMGFRAYYGDATRVDLLETAGAAEAAILVCAIGCPETTRTLVETARQHFPNLHLMVRVENRYEAYEYLREGIDTLYRETLHTSIQMGVDVLRKLGMPAHTAHRSGLGFLRHDERTMRTLAVHHGDTDAYIANVRKAIQLQEELIQSDLGHQPSLSDEAWDSDPLRKGFAKPTPNTEPPKG